MSHSEWFVSTKHRGPLHTARPTALPRLSDTSADYRLTIQYSRERQTDCSYGRTAQMFFILSTDSGNIWLSSAVLLHPTKLTSLGLHLLQLRFRFISSTLVLTARFHVNLGQPVDHRVILIFLSILTGHAETL